VGVNVYDLFGNKVATWTLPAGANASATVNENIASLAPGMYIYSIFENNDIVQRNKFVIAR